VLTFALVILGDFAIRTAHFIVPLTGWGQDEDKRPSQEVGFNYQLVKPVEPAALEKLLAELKSETG
jgi:hypothetical protein